MTSDYCNELILNKMSFNAAYNSRFRLTVMVRRRLQRAVYAPTFAGKVLFHATLDEAAAIVKKP
jgi:hypothetical protein